MKKIFNSFYATMAVCLLAVVFALPFGASATAFAVSGTVVYGLSTISGVAGVINAGLNKEIWLPEFMEGFYGDDSFISELRDMSAFVTNDVINLAEAGVNPDVLVNNTAYPVPYANRTDVPIALPLDTYDTENTLVQSIEIAELAYDKRASIIYGHKQALRMTFMQKAAHAIAPATDSALTPKIATTGTDNGSGLKKMKWSDVRDLQRRFDDAEIPVEGRIIVLSARHMEDLELEDVDRFNKVMDKGMICTFKIYTLAAGRLPRYNKTTGAKVAYGAAAASTDSVATIAFHKDEVMKSLGSDDMFLREKDPELRGDLIGFQKRALALPIRNKGIAAIYSPAV